MLLQIISAYGPSKDGSNMPEYAESIETAARQMRLTVLGISATLGDLYGYCTTLVQFPANANRTSIEHFGTAFANIACGKFTILDSMEYVGRWEHTKAGNAPPVSFRN